MNIAILGKEGMLSSMMHTVMPDATVLARPDFDAENPWSEGSSKYDVVVNAVGVIKPYCDDIERAIKVNAIFPHSLPSDSIQIATDCVYSGKKGKYVETDPHDALDVYGKTKSLGEASHISNLRCSIIGPELKNHISLLDWFLDQDKANGYTNHLWNGVTTLAFSKIVKGAIENNIKLPEMQHIVPKDVVTKAGLLRIIAEAYGKDIPVKNVEAPEAVDRTLSTINPSLNKKLWKAAGYDGIPTIKEMVEELAHH